MAENPAQMIRSWEKVQSFNNGPVVRDSLTPVTYGRVNFTHAHLEGRETQQHPRLGLRVLLHRAPREFTCYQFGLFED